VDFVLKTGTIESTLDEKGRVVIPASMRDRYTGTLVITQGKEECVWVMTPAVYQTFIKKHKKQFDEDKISAEEYEAFQDLHESNAVTGEIDSKTGRILIPPVLRAAAHLSKDCRDCLVVSIRNHIEIWNAEQRRVHINEVRQINKNTNKKLLGKDDFFSEKDGEI